MLKPFVKSTVIYGAKVWTLDHKTRNPINTVEMMHRRRCYKKTLIGRITNVHIVAYMYVETYRIEETEKRQLLRYGLMRCMSEERSAKKYGNKSH